jgi:putative ABC transport system ATP-binding protein
LRIDGVELTRLNAIERAQYRARSVGFVFQLFHLVPYLSVHRNVLSGLPPGVAVEPTEADRWIDTLGLTERRDANPATLSAGERQRVALARALVKRPPLILADEPTGNLDPDNAARVLEHLDHYRRAGGTVVLVTHGSEANRYATQRLRLEAGHWAIPSAFPSFNDSAS